MRVIAGSAGGIRLDVPKTDVRPTMDRVKAAIFSSLGDLVIGAHVLDVQTLWKDIYNWPDFPADGRQWDRLFNDGEAFKVGSIDAKVMFSPGHTLASITYVIGDAAFVQAGPFRRHSGKVVATASPSSGRADRPPPASPRLACRRSSSVR